MARSSGEKLIADNRRARHEYHLLERLEAGLVLTGSEVKSLRDGRADLKRAYADIRDGEAWLIGSHIAGYDHAGYANHDPDRPRNSSADRSNAARASVDMAAAAAISPSISATRASMICASS